MRISLEFSAIRQTALYRTNVRRRDRFDEFGNIFKSLISVSKIIKQSSLTRCKKDDSCRNRLFYRLKRIFAALKRGLIAIAKIFQKIYIVIGGAAIVDVLSHC